MSNIEDHESFPFGWKTRWALRRNRILGSRKFQRWAAKTPLFRSVARRKAAGQFDLIAGFVYTQIVYVYVETGLLDFLGAKPRSNAEIADFLGLDSEPVDRILRAGAALKLCESPERNVCVLGEVGAALSVNEGAMAMIRHHRLLYRDLADPIELFSRPRGVGNGLAGFWTYASNSDGNAQPYSQLMAATQPMVWEQIIDRYSFANHHRMLDIGGGSGAFVEAVAKASPGLEFGVFDLPDVTPLGRARFAGSAFEDRVAIHTGSFRSDSLPEGYDLITLVRILHDHDDDVAQALLEKVFDSLQDGGRLLIMEPMAQTRGAEAMGDAYFGLYLWAMGSGRPRSFAENQAMVKKAGFSDVKEIATSLPIIARVLVATK